MFCCWDFPQPEPVSPLAELRWARGESPPSSRGSLADILRLTESNVVILYGDRVLYEDSDKQFTGSLKSLSLVAKMRWTKKG
jgi:hypothetical protein